MFMPQLHFLFGPGINSIWFHLLCKNLINTFINVYFPVWYCYQLYGQNFKWQFTKESVAISSSEKRSLLLCLFCAIYITNICHLLTFVFLLILSFPFPFPYSLYPQYTHYLNEGERVESKFYYMWMWLYDPLQFLFWFLFNVVTMLICFVMFIHFFVAIERKKKERGKRKVNAYTNTIYNMKRKSSFIWSHGKE